MALQRRGRPRYDLEGFYHSKSSDRIHILLVKELGAELIPDTDDTKTQPWAPTLEDIRERQEEMGLLKHLEEKGIDVGAIPLDPFAVDPGIYTVALEEAKLRPIDGNADYECSLDIRFMVLDDDTEHGHKFAGKFITDGKWVPSAFLAETNPEEAEKKAGYIIQRLAQLGFEEPSEVDAPDINKLKGTKYKLKYEASKSSESDNKFVKWVKPIAEADLTDDL